MSTKTLRKRIALVAVSALGFGVMSVVPATAAARTATSAGQFGTVTAGAAAGPVMTATLGGRGGNTDTLAIQVTSGPSGGIFTVTQVGADNTTDTTHTVGASASDNTGIAAPADGAVIIQGGFNLPGTYTVILGASTTATATINVANPATTVPVASTSNAAPVAGTDEPVITVFRPAGFSGDLYATVTASPDADLTVGTSIKTSVSNKVTIAQVGLGGTTDAARSSFTLEGSGANDVVAAVGAYKFLFWIDSNANGIRDASEPVSAEFTQNLVGAASTVSASSDVDTRANVTGYKAFTVTASAVDAAGAGLRTAPTIVEATGTNLTNIDSSTTMTSIGGGQYIINAEINADPTGDYTDVTLTVTVGSKTADVVIRVAAVGTLSSLTSISTADVAGVGLVTSGVKTQALVGSGTSSAGDLAFTVDRAVTSVTYTFYAAAGEEGEYFLVDVAPAAGTGTDKLAPAKAIVKIGANLEAKYTVAVTSPIAASSTTGAAATKYVLTASGVSADVTATATYATATPAWTISPSANIKAKFGDSTTVTGSLRDQFGRVIGSVPVSVVVAGRQAGTYLGTADANGSFAFTWKDVNAATTVTLTDSLTFNYSYLASATSTSTTTLTSSARTVTYSATGIAVGSVGVSAPSNSTDRPIDQAQNGAAASSSVVSYTATVYDAAGLPVAAGALVTFKGGADDLFTTGSTGVTDEFGQASVSVYRQKAGAPSITATAGGITSPVAAAVTWKNLVRDTDATSAGEAVPTTADWHARYLTLTADNATVVSEGIIRFTAKVTDRFGNPVAGVAVTFAETGAGRFYNPPASNTADTNSAGEVSIDLNSQAGETGTASVSALITDANARQIDDIAGLMSFVTIDSDTANGVSGLTVGADRVATVTTTVVTGLTAAVKAAAATATITKNTATSTADALLALATALGTRDQASATVDAAAEATDAANAATDAANAAAEAADAATAAAQDASDAVAALSAQVSEAIAGLKKQLVSLTNLVIKIQKKVKA